MPEQMFTEADLERLHRYDQMDLVQRGLSRHRAVPRGHNEPVQARMRRLFRGRKAYDEDTRDESIAYNVAGFISETYADFLFLDPPSIAPMEEKADKERDWLGEWEKRNSLPCMLWASAYSNSARGDEYWKIRTEEGDSIPILESVDPRQVRPIFQPMNQMRPIGYDVLTPLPQDKDAKRFGTEKFLRERHFPGLIETRVIVLDQDLKITATIDPADAGFDGRTGMNGITRPMILPEQETGVDELLVLHIPNFQESGKFFGLSDYRGNLVLVLDAINHRGAQIEKILDILSDPHLMGPLGAIDNRKKFPLSGGKYLDLQPGDPKIEAIVWKSEIEAHQVALDAQILRALSLAGVWPGLFDQDKFGAVSSGRALKLRMMKTEAGVRRKWKFYRQGIMDAVRISQKLQAAVGGDLGFEPADAVVKNDSGMPVDPVESVEIETKAVREGLRSRRMAIENLNPEMSAEEIDAEMERIQDEADDVLPGVFQDAQEVVRNQAIRNRIRGVSANQENGSGLQLPEGV